MNYLCQEKVFVIMEPAAGLTLPVNSLLGDIVAQAAAVRLPAARGQLGTSSARC
jgi:hypothetical protein